MAEKSGVAPMLETIIPRSSGETTCADQVLHFGDFVLRDGEPRSRRGLQVDHELAGIGAREEGQPEQRKQRQAGDEQPRRRPPASAPGRRSDAAHQPVVDLAGNASKRSLNQTLNRSPKVAPVAGVIHRHRTSDEGVP